MFGEYVTTLEVPAIVGMTYGSIRAYTRRLPGWPEPIRIGNTNFYKRSELVAWKRHHEAQKRKRQRGKAQGRVRQ